MECEQIIEKNTIGKSQKPFYETIKGSTEDPYSDKYIAPKVEKKEEEKTEEK